MQHDDDWNTLVSYLPADWEEAAHRDGALIRMRGFDSAEALLRVLLIHLAQGCSLRETALRAKRGGIAEVSDVAILKRLRGAERWLHGLCTGLCSATVATPPKLTAGNRRLLAIDATCVSEPGSTGTDWRVHYALELPSLRCPHFELTDATGGEGFARFPMGKGDLVLADRGYCRVGGIQVAMNRGADVLVRMMLGQQNAYTPDSRERFDFLGAAADLAESQAREWNVVLRGNGGKWVEGRLCVLRRPEAVAELERTRTLREAKKKNRGVRERTLRAASFVGLFTTVPKDEYSANDLFSIYRFRWQVEMAFKRLKSIGGLGHLPKHDPASCRAWLYGKLLVGLLAERIAQTAFFP